MTYSVLLLGATGYLGGTILTDLERSNDEYTISCVVRPERTACLAGHKVELVVASHDDLAKIEAASAKADIVINAATSDDLALTKAINRGLAASTASSKGVLIHFSGTQLIESQPSGRLEPDVPIYDDTDLAQLQSIPDTALHRLIDLEIVRADLAGDLKASIICPGVIFGTGSGPLKTLSGPFPNLVRLALQHDRVVYAGEGTNVWAHVHIRDVSALLFQCIKHNLAATAPAGFERFYLYKVPTHAENGEHQKLQLCTQLASFLHARGAVSDPTPRSVPVDSPMAPSWANRTTSRCVANRARRELGWAPQIKLEDMLEEEFLDILQGVQAGGLSR